jgi:hypothetical protein
MPHCSLGSELKSERAHVVRRRSGRHMRLAESVARERRGELVVRADLANHGIEQLFGLRE